MAFCRLFFPLLALSVVSASNVPVFLWGLSNTSLKSNPLTTLNDLDFVAVLDSELKENPFLVVFIEESLSVEDLSGKTPDGETSYTFLQDQVPDSVYLPSVADALDVLNNYAENADQVELTDSGLSEDVENYNNKAVFISLMDAKEGESRADMLRRHDGFIREVYDKLENKYDQVIGIYTARKPSWTIPVTHSRVRRQTNDTAVGPPEYVMDGLRLYVKEIMVTTATSSANITAFVDSKTEFNGTVMNTMMNFGETSLTLNFRSAGGYWFFDSVTLKQTSPAVDVELYPTTEVHAILGFSYRCQQLIKFTHLNKTNSITFEDMKVQPFFETTNETMVFGDSFNCVGFFSAPIWSGLFVVFILLAITFYGIMMMLDIRTMDRFDDPKGKTITINAGE